MSLCELGCGRPVVAHGLCRREYFKRYRARKKAEGHNLGRNEILSCQSLKHISVDPYCGECGEKRNKPIGNICAFCENPKSEFEYQDYRLLGVHGSYSLFKLAKD